MTADALFWRKVVILTAALTSGALLVLIFYPFGSETHTGRIEAAKLSFQFLSITLGGGVLVAYLARRRDIDQSAAADAREADKKAAADQIALQARNAARQGAIQELIIELGDAHRRLKVVKRQMRAQVLHLDGGSNGRSKPPYRPRVDAFERAMDGLLNAQIAAEEVRDRIAIRRDLLSSEEITRVRKALRYGARYFHDVYQDYERCRVTRDNEHYVVTESCASIVNFLATGEDLQFRSGSGEELEAQFRVMKNDDRDLVQRHEALRRIEALREADPARRRYRLVATECFALAADELREAVKRDIPLH